MKNLKLSQYNKTLVTVAGIVLTGLNVLYGTNPAVQLLISLSTLGGVYVVPNRK